MLYPREICLWITVIDPVAALPGGARKSRLLGSAEVPFLRGMLTVRMSGGPAAGIAGRSDSRSKSRCGKASNAPGPA